MSFTIKGLDYFEVVFMRWGYQGKGGGGGHLWEEKMSGEKKWWHELVQLVVAVVVQTRK